MTGHAEVTGLVLAGGRSTRMGSDKALVPLHGRPMIDWVIERLRPQVGDILVNANSDDARLAEFGYPLIPDSITDYRGPLAGVHAAMAISRTPWLACVPCDAPLLPADLVARLLAALDANPAMDVAVAKTPASLQPTFFVCRTTLRPSIEAYLADGHYALKRWMERVSCIEVEFTDETPFSNINTPQEAEAFMPHLLR